MNAMLSPFRLASLPLALVIPLAADAASAPSYPDIVLGGVVEVEAFQTRPYTGSDESDILLSTGALGLEAAINEWIRAEISTLYEEKDTPLEVDTASVMLGADDRPWSLRAGQFYLPFGVYATAMLSDPLTLELGETRETAIAAGLARDGFSGAIYAFSGDLEEDTRIDSFGVTAGYVGTLDGADVALSAGYLNNLGESDGLEEAVYGNTGGADIDEVAAWTASASLGIGELLLGGEYLAASDRFGAGELAFSGSGARPAAWNLEASYRFALSGKPARAAIGYQGTEEALALELPERRVVAALSVEIVPSASLSLEYAHDRDYGIADGGTGETAGTFTTQLSITF